MNQEPSLFSFTLRENIAYGLPDDEATPGKIEQAAKMANIHDFILSLPQVSDALLSEVTGTHSVIISRDTTRKWANSAHNYRVVRNNELQSHEHLFEIQVYS